VELKSLIEEVKAWKERPLNEEHYAIYLGRTFLSVCRGKAAKESGLCSVPSEAGWTPRGVGVLAFRG